MKFLSEQKSGILQNCSYSHHQESNKNRDCQVALKFQEFTVSLIIFQDYAYYLFNQFPYLGSRGKALPLGSPMLPI